jgi:hypothetical protein
MQTHMPNSFRLAGSRQRRRHFSQRDPMGRRLQDMLLRRIVMAPQYTFAAESLTDLIPVIDLLRPLYLLLQPLDSFSRV